MLKFVENKRVNWRLVEEFLAISQKENQWSNFGPVSRVLENKIHEMLHLKEDQAVVACSSASLAMFALVEMLNIVNQKSLKWCVSSYGFPCTIQGPLQKACVVDCNQQGFLNLHDLEHEDFDGLLVTNLFGLRTSLEEYKHYCLAKGKIFFVDSAMAFLGCEHGVNEVISFHHTKPWGFGEGGCAIILKEQEPLFRSLISCGMASHAFIQDLFSLQKGTNGKLSDVSSAFILQHLENIQEKTPVYQEQYERVTHLAKKLGFQVLLAESPPPFFPSQVPLLAPFPLYCLENSVIELKKYYKPLSQNTFQANLLYDRMINVPCHSELRSLKDVEIQQTLENLLH